MRLLLLVAALTVTLAARHTLRPIAASGNLSVVDLRRRAIVHVGAEATHGRRLRDDPARPVPACRPS